MPDTNDVVRVTCVKDTCGTFPMDRALYRKLKRTGDTWACPAGHQQHFTESIEQQLRARIEQLEEKLESKERDREHQRERANELFDRYVETNGQRKALKRALLDRADGVVELDDEYFLWGCACGGRCQKAFESYEAASDALHRHKRDTCDLQNGTEKADA